MFAYRIARIDPGLAFVPHANFKLGDEPRYVLDPKLLRIIQRSGYHHVEINPDRQLPERLVEFHYKAVKAYLDKLKQRRDDLFKILRDLDEESKDYSKAVDNHRKANQLYTAALQQYTREPPDPDYESDSDSVDYGASWPPPRRDSLDLGADYYDEQPASATLSISLPELDGEEGISGTYEDLGERPMLEPDVSHLYAPQLLAQAQRSFGSASPTAITVDQVNARSGVSLESAKFTWVFPIDHTAPVATRSVGFAEPAYAGSDGIQLERPDTIPPCDPINDIAQEEELVSLTELLPETIEATKTKFHRHAQMLLRQPATLTQFLQIKKALHTAKIEYQATDWSHKDGSFELLDGPPPPHSTFVRGSNLGSLLYTSGAIELAFEMAAPEIIAVLKIKTESDKGMPEIKAKIAQSLYNSLPESCKYMLKKPHPFHTQARKILSALCNQMARILMDDSDPVGAKQKVFNIWQGLQKLEIKLALLKAREYSAIRPDGRSTYLKTDLDTAQSWDALKSYCQPGGAIHEAMTYHRYTTGYMMSKIAGCFGWKSTSEAALDTALADIDRSAVDGNAASR